MADLEKFRSDTRSWLEANAPKSMFGARGDAQEGVWGGKKAVYEDPDRKLWLDVMAEKGWTSPTWPTEYGGGGLSSEEAKILAEEMRRLKLPAPLVGFGLTMIGPTLLQFGTEEQKKEHLPRICRGEIRWCQGYSEPDAGSDLAALQCKADGRRRPLPDHRDQGVDLLRRPVRLDLLPGPHRSEGEEAGGHHLHPDRHGEPRGDGASDPADQWRLALLRDLLRERTRSQGQRAGDDQRRLDRRQGVARARAQHDRRHFWRRRRRQAQDPGRARASLPPLRRWKAVRSRVPRRDCQDRARRPGLCAHRAAHQGRGEGRTQARSGELSLQGLRHRAQHAPPGADGEDRRAPGARMGGEGFEDDELSLTRDWLRSRGNALEGGSSEIQRNIIAKRVLGLPD